MTKLNFLTTPLLLLFATDALAWGPVGPRIIGEAAFGLLDDSARAQVLTLLDLPPGGDPGLAGHLHHRQLRRGERFPRNPEPAYGALHGQ